MAELYAFFGRTPIGLFHQFGGRITFEYAPGYTGTPLSLSLLPNAEHAPEAALAYLDNLLPDHTETRERWARARSLSSADPFTLLSAYGEDVAGAVSLSSDPGLPQREAEPLVEATQDDIAERIASLRINDSSWSDPRVKPRMSLAGMQGKFTLTKIGNRWFWPTYETPSTHIIKPPSKKHRSIERFESLGLELARAVGIEASRAETMEFLGQPTFIVERWDREPGLRLPAEDLNQSLGRRTSEKYGVQASEAARLLARFGMEKRFVRQLAFNVAFGNSDAHAKNYSVLLAGKQVQLAPLYDTVPVHFWPEFENTFAMSVGSAQHPAELVEDNWRTFAKDSGLDGDMVCHEAFTVMSRVAERYEDIFREGGTDQARMLKLAKHVKVLRRAIPPQPPQ